MAATDGRLAGARRELNGINGYQRAASVTVEPYCTRFAQNFREYISNDLVRAALFSKIVEMHTVLPPSSERLAI